MPSVAPPVEYRPQIGCMLSTSFRKRLDSSGPGVKNTAVSGHIRTRKSPVDSGSLSAFGLFAGMIKLATRLHYKTRSSTLKKKTKRSPRATTRNVQQNAKRSRPAWLNGRKVMHATT